MKAPKAQADEKVIQNIDSARRLAAAIILHGRNLAGVLGHQTQDPKLFGQDCEQWVLNVELNYEILTGLFGVEPTIRALVTHEVRRDTDLSAKHYCRAVCGFGQSILESNIPFVTKSAVFYDFNIIGLLFDRSRENYYICEPSLREFLVVLRDFLATLADCERHIWYGSTFAGGPEQVETLSARLDEASLGLELSPELIALRAAAVK